MRAGHRYGDMVPASVAGRWVTVVYILSSTFIVINVVANFATLPAMFHRRTTDELILSQVCFICTRGRLSLALPFIPPFLPSARTRTHH